MSRTTVAIRATMLSVQESCTETRTTWEKSDFFERPTSAEYNVKHPFWKVANFLPRVPLRFNASVSKLKSCREFFKRGKLSMWSVNDNARYNVSFIKSTVDQVLRQCYIVIRHGRGLRQLVQHLPTLYNQRSNTVVDRTKRCANYWTQSGKKISEESFLWK